MVRLRFESNFSGRDFERQLKRVVNDRVEEIGEDLQRVFDALYRSHRGRPVEVVKSHLEEAWRRSGPDRQLTDPQLSKYASAISAGDKVRVGVEKL